MFPSSQRLLAGGAQLCSLPDLSSVLSVRGLRGYWVSACGADLEVVDGALLGLGGRALIIFIRVIGAS
jgi:hypothetical protein